MAEVIFAKKQNGPSMAEKVLEIADGLKGFNMPASLKSRLTALKGVVPAKRPSSGSGTSAADIGQGKRLKIEPVGAASSSSSNKSSGSKSMAVKSEKHS